MRPADRPGTHGWLLFPAGVLVLVLSGFTAGCSSTPAYCTAADQLKASVHNLGNVDVAKSGIGSLQAALSSVQTSAKTFASEAKSAFPSQTTALRNSLSALQATIKSAHGEPLTTAAAAIVPAVAEVKSSADDLEGAVSAKCQ